MRSSTIVRHPRRRPAFGDARRFGSAACGCPGGPQLVLRRGPRVFGLAAAFTSRRATSAWRSRTRPGVTCPVAQPPRGRFQNAIRDKFRAARCYMMFENECKVDAPRNSRSCRRSGVLRFPGGASRFRVTARHAAEIRGSTARLRLPHTYLRRSGKISFFYGANVYAGASLARGNVPASPGSPHGACRRRYSQRLWYRQFLHIMGNEGEGRERPRSRRDRR